MSQRPLAVGLLLCEQIIVDAKTKRLTPVNCFSQWVIDGPLSQRQSFHILAILTSGHGRMPAALTIDRLDTDERIVLKEFMANFADPLEQYRWMMRLRGLQFPVQGGYQVSLFMDGECIASARFTIVHKE